MTLSAAAYAAIAVVLTYPLIRHLSTTLPHDLGDPLLSTTVLWWNAHTVPLSHGWWNAFFFWPAPGAIAFSDHRLGESLLATPLQWMGLGAISAANLVFLVSFPLSALAAHALAFTLTRRHDAGVIAGLAYGFCPYRIAHVQHLELLAGFGMPLALAALHRYVETSRGAWLVAFAAALVVQALCCSYYILFFSVLMLLWVCWFVDWRDRRTLVSIGSACAVAAAVLAPVVIGYERVHVWYGFERSLDEIARLSADLTAIGVASPLSALWGWTAAWARSEGEIFPGLTITAVALVGTVVAWRRLPSAGDAVERWRWWVLVAAAGCAAVAICGWTFAPWRIDLRVLTVSSAAPFKPFSIAVVSGIVWLMMSSRWRQLRERRSVFAFYALATLILLLCALGPKPVALGRQFLYEPIYAWLLELPIFGSVRVPARFAMLAMLTLATTGALAFDRLVGDRRTRGALAALVACGVMADGLVTRLPLPSVPDRWPAARAEGFDAVLELPLGDVFDDTAAMYRATLHGHPVLNGSSGFEPTHYFTLRTALEERDASLFAGLPQGRILIVVDRQRDSHGALAGWLGNAAPIRALGGDARWAFFAADGGATPRLACDGTPSPIASINAGHQSLDRGALTDGNPKTRWDSSHPQATDDALTIDLGRATHPCAVVLSVGEFRKNYPRRLVVETSSDSRNWNTVATERTAGLTIRGALDDPATVPITIPLGSCTAPLGSCTARYVRLRLGEAHRDVSWVVTDVAVRVAPVEE